MSVAASAPGKLILLGEYAVLDGATALVAAVDRRATVFLVPAAGDESSVRAPDLGVEVTCRLGSGTDVTWNASPERAARMGLVTAVLADTLRAGTLRAGTLPTDTLPAFEADLSTQAFFDRPSAGKLGLGSSAALTVALAGALRRFADLPAASLAELVRCHRALQGGRGSGADVAAALHGGVIAYAGGDTDTPAAVPARLPATIELCCVFAGHSTSTADYLRRLGTWRAEHPGPYRTLMQRLADTAVAGVAATGAGDATSFLAAVADYGHRLDELGTASGTDIVGAAHRRIGALADRCGVVYKTSGAGGGDVGICFADDPARIDAFRHEVARSDVARAGGGTIELAVDPDGLTVTGRGQQPPTAADDRRPISNDQQHRRGA